MSSGAQRDGGREGVGGRRRDGRGGGARARGARARARRRSRRHRREANRRCRITSGSAAHSVWPDGELPRTEGTRKLKRGEIRTWVNRAGPRARPGEADPLRRCSRRFAAGPDAAAHARRPRAQLPRAHRADGRARRRVPDTPRRGHASPPPARWTTCGSWCGGARQAESATSSRSLRGTATRWSGSSAGSARPRGSCRRCGSSPAARREGARAPARPARAQ
jgi:hypothetical protein